MLELGRSLYTEFWLGNHLESYYLEMGAHDITGELKETVVIGLEMD